MKPKHLVLAIYAAVQAVYFYVFPFTIIDTGSAIVMMLAVLPLATFFGAVATGALRGFTLWVPLVTAVLFTPTVWLHYNSSAWVYIVFYALLALAGNALAALGGALWRRFAAPKQK